MESTESELPDAELEFSVEELEEALKPKPGRPSKRSQELRQRLREAGQLRDIMGIINSGLLDQLVGENVSGSNRVDTEGPIRVKKDKQVPEGIVEELLLKSGLFNQKFIKTNKQFIILMDDMVSKAIVEYGPPVIAITGAVVGMWLAEDNIDGFPPVLHTLFNILALMVNLINIATSAIAWWAELNPIDTVKDAVDDAITRRREGKTIARTAPLHLTGFIMKTLLGFGFFKADPRTGKTTEDEQAETNKERQERIFAELDAQGKPLPKVPIVDDTKSKAF